LRDYALRALLPSVVGSNPGVLIPISPNKKSPEYRGFFFLERRVRDYATRALLPSVVGSNPGVLIPISPNKKSPEYRGFFFVAESEAREPTPPNVLISSSYYYFNLVETI
jgi:hypothetical protein